MADLDLKAWFRSEIAPYLTTIKANITSLSGEYMGSFTTVAAFPAVAKNRDWVILSTDDASNESGIYAYDGTNWGFAQDLVNFSEIVSELIATNTEADAGTSTTKTMNVAQVHSRFAKKLGDSANKFSANTPEEATNEVVRAADFNFTITTADAQADYAGA
jgi:hypothetical protein